MGSDQFDNTVSVIDTATRTVLATVDVPEAFGIALPSNSIAQLCPCAGPRGTTQPWKNHGQYVSCVAKSAQSFLQQGLITSTQKAAIVSSAGQSACGKHGGS